MKFTLKSSVFICDVLIFRNSGEKNKQEGKAVNFQGFPQRDVVPLYCLICRNMCFKLLKYENNVYLYTFLIEIKGGGKPGF